MIKKISDKSYDDFHQFLKTIVSGEHKSYALQVLWVHLSYYTNEEEVRTIQRVLKEYEPIGKIK
jgi:hypothetical protein